MVAEEVIAACKNSSFVKASGGEYQVLGIASEERDPTETHVKCRVDRYIWRGEFLHGLVGNNVTNVLVTVRNNISCCGT